MCCLHVFEEGDNLSHGSICRKGIISLLPLISHGSPSHTSPFYFSPPWTKEEHVDEHWAEVLTQCVWTSAWEICWRVWQKTCSYFYCLVVFAIVNNGGKVLTSEHSAPNIRGKGLHKSTFEWIKVRFKQGNCNFLSIPIFSMTWNRGVRQSGALTIQLRFCFFLHFFPE